MIFNRGSKFPKGVLVCVYAAFLLGCGNNNIPMISVNTLFSKDVVLLTTRGQFGGEIQIQSNKIIVSKDKYNFNGSECLIIGTPDTKIRVDHLFDKAEKIRRNAKSAIKLKQKWIYGIIPWGKNLYVNGEIIDTGDTKIYEIWEAYYFQDGILAIGRSSVKHDYSEPNDFVFIDIVRKQAVFEVWNYKSPYQICFWNSRQP